MSTKELMASKPLTKLEVVATRYVLARADLRHAKLVKNGYTCSERSEGDPSIGDDGVLSCWATEGLPQSEWCEQCKSREDAKKTCHFASKVCSNLWKQLKRNALKI